MKGKDSLVHKELTRRSWNIGYARRKEVLTQTIRGWVTYFRHADMRSFLEDTDQWLRSRIRMCIWKSWKRVRTRFKNLQKCGIAKWQAWQWANSPSGRRGNGQTAVKAIAVLLTASCIVLPQQRN